MEEILKKTEKTWACKICLANYKRSIKTFLKQGLIRSDIDKIIAKDITYTYEWRKGKACLNCGLTEDEVNKLWICPKCYEVNEKHDERRLADKSYTERCEKCKAKRKVSAWTRDVPSREEIAAKINAVALWEKSKPEYILTVQVLSSLLYLLGSRVSEVVSTHFKPDSGPEFDVYRLRVGDIKLEEHNGNQFIVVYNVALLKKRPKYGEVLHRRPIPIMVEKEPEELINPIIEYLELYHDKPQKILFTFGRKQARDIIKRVFGDDSYCHLLRHTRATHLRSYYNFDILQIRDFFSHTNLEASMRYVHEDSSALIAKMSKQ